MKRSINCVDNPNSFRYPLDCCSRSDLETVGGKAANLGELIQAGFPVPPGFVIPIAGYDRFVEHNRLDPAIPQALQNNPDGATIRKAFEAGAIPAELEQEILQGYQALGGGPVAVRSSATAEDLPGAAFAGQQDTYLNVISEEQLLNTVKSCWASLWTERAIAYRNRQSIDQRTVKLAVVVQRMAKAEAAGVMFTANPITGARDEMAVDANPGLGEAVVSGAVTPDHYLLRKNGHGWSISERRIGKREVIVRPSAAGGIEQTRGGDGDQPQAISDGTLFELARRGEAIQQHFGAAQDIEWVWTGNQILIVQSRPVTALPEPAPRPSQPVQMLSGMFAEMFPVRPYPLDMTTWVPAISEAAVVPIFSLIGLTPPSLPEQFTEEEGVVGHFTANLKVHPTPAMLLAPFRFLYLCWKYPPENARADPLLVGAQQRARELEAIHLAALSWNDLLTIVRAALALTLPLAGEIRRRYYPRPLLAAGALRLALLLLGDGKQFSALMSGAESRTIEANHALEALATRVRSDPQLAEAITICAPENLQKELRGQAAGQSFLAELDQFLEEYGHREVVLSTAFQPTWKDDPAIVLEMLKGMVMAGASHKTGEPAWATARDELLKHPLLKIAPLRTAMLNLIADGRAFWQIREDTHFEATRILPILRRTFLEMGRRLSDAGVLDRPEEVFHLKFGELETVSDDRPLAPELVARLHMLVSTRKARRAELEGSPLIDPRLYRQSEPEGEVLLRGAAGSAGTAAGPVRVVHNVSEFGKLRSGDVLVAPYTNPAWTPLFQRAAAVVVDGGAAGSHAAIVAREYGIPAVMGTIDGTQKLQDDQWVQVDGTRGVVIQQDQEAQ